jgi:hypothetical protein
MINMGVEIDFGDAPSVISCSTGAIAVSGSPAYPTTPASKEGGPVFFDRKFRVMSVF